MSRLGKTPRGFREGAGFTLVEILLVIALFALLSTVLITGVNALFPGDVEEDAETVILAAMQDARREAVLTGRVVTLQIDEKEHHVVWSGGTPVTFPEQEKLRLVQPKLEASVLIGGVLMETPLAEARFFPDGTCDPLRVQLVRGQQTRFIAIDPWTCAPLPEKST